MKNNNKTKCKHKRIKKIFIHGYRSRVMIVCKDCGNIIKKENLKSK